MIPLAYESFYARERIFSWERKNTIQKLGSCIKYKLFGGNRPSQTENEKRPFALQKDAKVEK